MDCSLTSSEKRRYEAWLHSPSVISPDFVETILAVKIAMKFHYAPTATLRALRGQERHDEKLTHVLEAFVTNDPSLAFRQDGPVRRVALSLSSDAENNPGLAP